MYELGISRLPSRVRPSLIRFADSRSLFELIAYGIGVYLLVILLGTCADFFATKIGHQVVIEGDQCITGFWNLLYFNFVTILTVGYGDFAPVGLGRLISVLQALMGIGIFGSVIGVLVVKLMLPRKDAVVFSKYCYFDQSEKRFVVVFVNTMDMPLINAEMCSLLKMGRGEWVVYPAFTAPYVGDSAWTFSINPLGKYDNNFDPDDDTYLNKPTDLSGRVIFPDDSIKFGISGSYGFATFAATKKYSFKEVWVIPSKSALPLDALRNPDLSSPDFAEKFHYVPPEGRTFESFAAECGAIINDG